MKDLSHTTEIIVQLDFPSKRAPRWKRFNLIFAEMLDTTKICALCYSVLIEVTVLSMKEQGPSSLSGKHSSTSNSNYKVSVRDNHIYTTTCYHCGHIEVVETNGPWTETETTIVINQNTSSTTTTIVNATDTIFATSGNFYDLSTWQ